MANANNTNLLERFDAGQSNLDTGVSSTDKAPTAPLKREYPFYINNTFKNGTYDATISVADINRLQDTTAGQELG